MITSQLTCSVGLSQVTRVNFVMILHQTRKPHRESTPSAVDTNH